MTVAGLRYRQKVYDAAPTVTKNGSFIYGGSPEDYHEWEFRTQLRIAAQEQRSRKVRKKKKDESFTTSSKPETGKKERTPKGASSERGSEHGPRSEGSFDGLMSVAAIKMAIQKKMMTAGWKQFLKCLRV